MRAKVIAVVNRKGGTGKTAVAHQQEASCTNAPLVVSAQFLAKPCIISVQERHQP